MKIRFLLLMASLLIACGQTEITDENTNKSDEAAKEINLQVALIKMADNGKNDELVGCGDSIVLVDKSVEGEDFIDSRKVSEALELLFETDALNQSELYNSLANSKNLAISSVNISENPGNTVIQVDIVGEMMSAGTCDDPRIKEQIYSTIEANAEADEIKVTINGEDLEGYFNMAG